jgi:hypothetical protein
MRLPGFVESSISAFAATAHPGPLNLDLYLVVQDKNLDCEAAALAAAFIVRKVSVNTGTANPQNWIFNRALHGDTLLHAFYARINTGPATAPPLVHYRVRHDGVDKSGPKHSPLSRTRDVIRAGQRAPAACGERGARRLPRRAELTTSFGSRLRFA